VPSLLFSPLTSRCEFAQIKLESLKLDFFSPDKTT
jgi:hypothetical protein